LGERELERDGSSHQRPLRQLINYMNNPSARRRILLAVCLASIAILAALALYLRPEPDPMGYGMHTLHGDSEELTLIHEAGFDWVVQLFSWRQIARWRGLYDWERPDAVVRGSEYYGLNLVVRLDQHPHWARAQSALNGPPDDLTDYGDFVHEIASRYKGRIKAYVIWNEPNLALEWGGHRPDPAAYVEMLKVACTRIKQADPNALVISAGLAPTNDQTEKALDDRLYLQAMYELGAKEYFDVLGAHVYGFGHPPDDPHGAHQGLNLARIQDLREIMVAYGDRGKPVWVTELGWTIAATDEHAWQQVSPEAQADYLVGAFRRTGDEWPWLELLTVWNLGSGLSIEDKWAGYSLIGPHSEPRPAYIALRDMPKGGTATRLRGTWDRCREMLAHASQEARPRALEEDVVIHLGDNHWPTPWVPLYQGRLPSTVWKGEFYVRDPAVGSWTLHIDVMQNNERTNYLLLNGHPMEPLYFPVEDYSRSWHSIAYSVPTSYLRVGPNEVTVVVGKAIPARQHPGTYEDLQFRDIVLERR